MSKGKSLLKNTLIIGVGKISTQFITFFLLPLYTGYLTTADFGIVDLLNTIITLLVPVITLQIEQGVFRFVIESRSKNNSSAGDYIKTSFIFILMQVILICFIFIIILPYIKNKYILFIFINLISTIFCSIFLQTIRGLGDNISYSIASLISGITSISLNVIFIAFLGLGAYGMLTATFIANVIVIIYLSYKCNIITTLKESSYDKSKLKQLIKYSIPLIPNSISWWIINVSDRSIISFVLGVSANGIYAVCNKISSIITTLFNIFYIAWVENVSINYESEDFKDYFLSTSENIFILFSIMCSLMIAVFPIIFPYLIKSAYFDAFYHIPILIIAMLFNVLQGLYGAIYVAKKQSTKLANSTIIGSVINITSHLLLINYIGLFAASLSTFLSYFVVSIYRYSDIKKQLNSKITLKPFVQIAILLTLPVLNYYTGIINQYFAILLTLIIIFILFRKKLNTIFSILKVLKARKKNA